MEPAIVANHGLALEIGKTSQPQIHTGSDTVPDQRMMPGLKLWADFHTLINDRMGSNNAIGANARPGGTGSYGQSNQAMIAYYRVVADFSGIEDAGAVANLHVVPN